MGETTVLLHTCCAPCSSAIIEAMVQNGITPVIYYCNPNIYPREEYEIRKNECTRYAQSLGLEIVDADYDHENWLEAVKGLEGEPERGGRCLKCFKLRLLRTAQYALERGIKVITTTLASSRWKSLDQINEAGHWACQTVSSGKSGDFPDKEPESGSLSGNRQEDTDKVIWWDRNWRKGGLQERRLQIIREYDFYNQLYCGCEFSMRKED
ncbi:MAG: epoxyqueuosine reductase QueH [Bacteroidales bacterium]|nr:epoxyqueuosine reductase QueH [Bacteroidales bacterium]